MRHFLYLIGFALCVALASGVFHTGDQRKKILHGAKVFAEFVGVALILAWIFYFIPGN
jgi:hypothetical protein